VAVEIAAGLVAWFVSTRILRVEGPGGHRALGGEWTTPDAATTEISNPDIGVSLLGR
jgi:hypothetical protein